MELELSTSQVDHNQPHFVTSQRFRAVDSSFHASILAAIIYADLFDYPLTLDELTRFQVGSALTVEAVRDLVHSPPLKLRLAESDGYYFLGGRANLVQLRKERANNSKKLWTKAHRYSKWMSRLPFVRMVAVTGALAVNNVGSRPDIDLLVVACDERVWLCRRALIVCVRLARLFGDELCPNYIIAESALELDQRDFFTAHELAHMIPAYGHTVYSKMLEANSWANDYLPNAFSGFTRLQQNALNHPIQRGVERLLRLPVFDGWERWELTRLRSKLIPRVGRDAEVICSPTQCKGHTSFHRERILAHYKQRLAQHGLDDHLPPALQRDFANA